MNRSCREAKKNKVPKPVEKDGYTAHRPDPESNKHSEVLCIEDMDDGVLLNLAERALMGGKKLHVTIVSYYSPCSECAKELVDFAKRVKIANARAARNAAIISIEADPKISEAQKSKLIEKEHNKFELKSLEAQKNEGPSPV